jgi:hypothetical protein
MAISLEISSNRVNDRWGGVFGAPSKYLPTTAYTESTTTSVATTTNSTNTTNTSRLLVTSYSVNLFI